MCEVTSSFKKFFVTTTTLYKIGRGQFHGETRTILYDCFFPPQTYIKYIVYLSTFPIYYYTIYKQRAHFNNGRRILYLYLHSKLDKSRARSFLSVECILSIIILFYRYNGIVISYAILPYRI